MRLEHPDAATLIFISSTPSDRRALANAAALLRRALPQPPKRPVQVDYSPVPKRPRRRPKPRPSEVEQGHCVQPR
jgi:hypothetical protein